MERSRLLFYLVGCCLLLDIGPARAQSIPGVEETTIVYKHIQHGGAMLHSSGWGINYRRGKRLSGYSHLLGDAALLTMRHPKEIKSVNQFSDRNNGYVYGKMNSLIILRTGIGKHKTVNARGDAGGVEVGYAYYGGLSWGFVKPVYLTVFYQSEAEGVHEKVERYDPEKHYQDNISGRAPFFKGIEETSLYPGLYGSFLLNFEFGHSQQRLRMLETGVCIDLFPRPVPIMFGNNPNSYFFTFFIRMLFGKQWNRS